MGSLIDSGIFIAAERGQLDLDQVLRSLGDDAIALSAVTASELLHGIPRADAGRRSQRAAFVEQILATVPVLPFTLAVARVHADIAAGLASQGKPLPAHDLLIGATAVAHGLRVVTRDRRSFPLIPGLAVVMV